MASSTASLTRVFRRGARLVGLVVTIGLLAAPAFAQSSAASLAGTVVDPSSAVLPGADVTVTNVATGVARSTITGTDGKFAFPSLVPGRYTVTVTLSGFSTAEVRDINLNINSVETIRVQMNLAGVGEQVTVVAEAERVSTSPAVSTVVDRQFVENLPLSGRSLQSLLQLTPGVTLFAANTNPLAGGQFSVNGQRTNANYFTVDGVSANANMSTGTGSFSGHSTSGALPSLSALGTTQSLVSVDALEEFRVQTSTYSPEFGRMPGGQIQMVTRAGTNKFTGSAAFYYRDDKMDSIDYFAKLNNLPKPRLDQKNFSGVLGGPIVRNKTFFFFSYEGLRLDLPQTYVGGVPTEELKAAATPAIRELLNTFPRANGPVLSPGVAQFATTYEDPSTLDAIAIRGDHTAGNFTIFARYNHSPSESTTRSSSRNTITENTFWNDSFTAGLTWVKGNMVNDLRGNWTDTRARQYRSFDPGFPGTSLPSEETMFPGRLTEFNSFYTVSLTGTGGFGFGTGNDNFQRQFNIVDTLTWVKGAHQLKTGVDFRRISPILNRSGSDFTSVLIGAVTNPPAGLVQLVQIARGNGMEIIPIFDNFSAFVQDQWTVNPRMTLTYGLRYELNPAPGSANDTLPLVFEDITAPLVEFAPEGTKLYGTRHWNFAPRFGIAYSLSQRLGRESILRGGVGNFYDTGFGVAGISFDHIFPYFLSKTVGNPSVPYPLTPEQAAPPDPATVIPQQFWQMDPNLKTPFTLQWNVSLEQAFGHGQSVTITYVGSNGHNQLRRESWSIQLADYIALYPTSRISSSLTRNGGKANYHGLQLSYQKRLSKGFQALANYTLGQSKDTISSDDGFRDGGAQQGLIDLGLEYGPSDYDVRHTYAVGATYSLPSMGSGFVRELISHWGIDGMVRGRSAFPMTPLITNTFGAFNQTVRPDLVPGQEVYWYGSQCTQICPGGWMLNRNAFVLPAPGTVGNFPRNSIRGFDAWQIDMSLRRDFNLPSATQLQFKFEVFNVSNHVNLADPAVNLTTGIFGVATQMLNRGLGSLNPLYQMGGPRSAQVSLKFVF